MENWVVGVDSDVYPKRGSYSKNNITDKELIKLLENLKEEENNLIEHSIFQDIEEIDVKAIEEAIAELSTGMFSEIADVSNAENIDDQNKK